MNRGHENYVDLLRWRAENHGDELAVRYLADGDTREACLTYGELDRLARAQAVSLRDHLEPGDRLLIQLPPGLDFIVGFLGCLYAGVVAVPAYPPRNAKHLPRIEAILKDADTECLLAHDDGIERMKQWLGGGLSGLSLLSRSGVDEARCDEWKRVNYPSESIAFLQYTSGSTGNPKGVMVTHGNLMANEEMIREKFQLDQTSVFVSWLPLFHDMGLIGNLLQPLYVGSHTVLMPPVAFLAQPIRWLRAISKYRARVTGAPNFAYDLCVRTIKSEQCADLDLSSLKLAYSGSEPIDADIMERFAGRFASCGLSAKAMYCCYGMAEATLLATSGIPGSGPTVGLWEDEALSRGQAVSVEDPMVKGRTVVSCGQQVPGSQVVVVDPDSKRRMSDCRVGEIWLQGKHIAAGYWNAPETTEESFRALLADETDAGTFYRTGDLGFLKDGDLYVTGRLKDVIIVHGRNHYPQDIEATVSLSHERLALGACAATSVVVGGGERLVVVSEVKREGWRRLPEDEIFDAICAAVSEAHELVVYGIVLLKPGALPKTSSGKVRRATCREGYLQESLDAVASWSQEVAGERGSESGQGVASPTAVRSVQEVEAWLVGKLSELTGRAPDAIQKRQAFARYGLDSVSVVRLAADLGAWLEEDVSPTLAYDFPDIESLANHLAGSPSEEVCVQSSAVRDPVEDQVAIVGVGCRFPGAASYEDYVSLLLDGTDAIREVPPDRWDVDEWYSGASGAVGKMSTRWGGFLDGVDGFDSEFFGVSPREVENMDPQQRLVLEVAWEALESGGLVPDQLRGSRTGVFVGISAGDYGRMLLSRVDGANAYSGIGNALSVAASRISYLLDLRGPSVAVDSACSSSLVAVHQARQSLLSGECDLVLAGGVNLILSPELTVAFSQAGMMSPTGRCRTFSNDADGYVRGEGCGMIVMKRWRDALAAGDEILAVVRGSAVNQDGHSNGLTAPNGNAQRRVMRDALASGRVRAEEVDYVEAHGTGTVLGDPVEMKSIQSVYRGSEFREHPLWVGSVKTNIGHLEAAAGIAGLIKGIVALQRETIPAHLHLKKLNEHLEIDDAEIRIPAEAQPWQSEKQRPRKLGVSSFGFGGTNAHVVLEESPPAKSLGELCVRPAEVLALSAKTASALNELTRAYQQHLGKGEPHSLTSLTYSSNTGRNHFDHRLALVASNVDECRKQLGDYLNGDLRRVHHSILRPDASPPPVVFLFSGQGAQYLGMGRELYEYQPVFRETVDQCATILGSQVSVSLREVLFNSKTTEALLNRTDITQPVLFTIEYALWRMWESWGIRPDYLIGHSIGEFAAACAAGVLSVEDALTLVVKRGQLMQSVSIPGAMISVFADEETVKSNLASCRGAVGIAAVNSPQQTVVSGEETVVQDMAEAMAAKGVKSVRLRVSQAFHSPLMEPIIDDFAAAARQVRFNPPSIPIVSNVSGGLQEEITNTDYWCRQLVSPVRFADCIAALEGLDAALMVELGPGRTLLDLGRECRNRGEDRWLASMSRSGDDWQVVAESLAAMQVAGVPLNWAAFYDGLSLRRVAIPSYPFQRESFWFEDRTPKSGKESTEEHPVLGARVRQTGPSRDGRWRLVRDGEAWEKAGFPCRAPKGKDRHGCLPFLTLALAAGRELFGAVELKVENLTLHAESRADWETFRELDVVVRWNSGGALPFHVSGRTGRGRRETLLASAQLVQSRSAALGSNGERSHSGGGGR